jgi:hypothetical protein
MILLVIVYFLVLFDLIKHFAVLHRQISGFARSFVEKDEAKSHQEVTSDKKDSLENDLYQNFFVGTISQ